jgi:hypothetical protein
MSNEISEKQQVRAFFAPNNPHLYPHLPPRPSDDDIRTFLARNNKHCPLNEIIVSEANESNFSALNLMCFSIMRRWDRNPRGNNFGLYCPPGQGKTFIVKRVAATLEIMFVFVQSPSIDSNYTLFETIRAEAQKFGTPIVADKSKGKKADFKLPPMLVFFDEAHKLSMSMMKGGLLNAMEPDDGIMVVKEPGIKGISFTVDCSNVCWIAATTDRGDMFDAFEQRLLNPIQGQEGGFQTASHARVLR